MIGYLIGFRSCPRKRPAGKGLGFFTRIANYSTRRNDGGRAKCERYGTKSRARAAGMPWFAPTSLVSSPARSGGLKVARTLTHARERERARANPRTHLSSQARKHSRSSTCTRYSDIRIEVLKEVFGGDQSGRSSRPASERGFQRETMRFQQGGNPSHQKHTPAYAPLTSETQAFDVRNFHSQVSA
jgi:hypothetical protein